MVRCLATLGFIALSLTVGTASAFELNDSHFHLTNYIQEGIDIHQFIQMMGERVGRVAIFGIPLQQQWSYEVSGNKAPKYYLDTDAPLYYYSFTDAAIAMAYKSLPKEQQARLDPMITGFNPTDMYAAEHVRRVLRTFPGVFSGIGEFSIHKEFVSGKVAGETASLNNPALDRLLDFAGEAGLVVLIHNDMDTPFSKLQSDVPDSALVAPKEPAYLGQMKALFKRHPRTTMIWAHIGLGRVIRPVKSYAAMLEEILKDPAFSHVYFDLSWTEVAKYLVSDPETTQVAANLFNKYPDRFLFGTDEVAPKNREEYLRIYEQYEPLWKRLTPETDEKIKKSNYERLFDAARKRVRAWERSNQ